MNSKKRLISCALKRTSKARLISVIRNAAVHDRDIWEKHLSRAEQVVVFGSCALGLQTTDSDIDVLCIGRGQSASFSALQILWMSESRLMKHVRRGSELACHVAAFGVWIKGKRSIPSRVIPSPATICRRRGQIASRCRALAANWRLLNAEFRAKHVRKIRRDLQRLALLKSGHPNIPAPALDHEWHLLTYQARRVEDWLIDDPDLLSAFTPELIRCVQGGNRNWRGTRIRANA